MIQNVKGSFWMLLCSGLSLLELTVLTALILEILRVYVHSTTNAYHLVYACPKSAPFEPRPGICT